jgi:N-methylhydantoinase B
MGDVQEVVRFESLRTELQAIADEMALRFAKSSFSPVIRDYLDFSTALCAADGRLVTQGFSLPLHLGAIPRAVEAVLARFREGLRPGDVVIVNDPYEGGMHLPDIFMVAPAHAKDGVVGHVVIVAHHSDIGGRAPGGSAADSREIFQEGLRLPPVHLQRLGAHIPEVERIVKANVRLPEQLWADLQAQLAGVNGGIADLVDLVDRHGRAVFGEDVERMLDQSRQRLEAILRTWPQGRYTFEDREDHNGIAQEEVPIRVAVTISRGRITFDFTDSHPQVAGSINATRSFTESACYAAVRALCDEDIPVNAGFLEAIDVIVPEASVVNAAFPAGVAARGVIGYRVIETVFGALAEAMPDMVPAAGDGGVTGVRLGGFQADGTRFQFNDLVCGAWGARPGMDGIDGAANMAANVANRPIEDVEREDPVRVHAYGFVPDSGGAGKWRGGLSIRRVIEVLAEEATFQLRSHRDRTPPYGLRGGNPGATSKTWLTRDGVRELLPAKLTTTVRAGDVIEHVTASGGGFGDPRERDDHALAHDVREGKVTVEHARRAYRYGEPEK